MSRLFPVRLPAPLAAAVLAAALMTGAPMSSHAQPTPSAAPTEGTLVSVSAEGSAHRVPDVAMISTGVVTQAADPNAAMQANSAQMTRVVAALKAAGIAERDIQTSGIGLNPQYRYAENQPPQITGYQANNTVTVKVRDIARLGKVLDALVASGANQISGPSFEVDQPEAAYDEARLTALKAARARADLYAKALDLRVVRVVSISEGGAMAPGPFPVMLRAKAEMDAAPAPPVSAGESRLAVTLNVVFELGR